MGSRSARVTLLYVLALVFSSSSYVNFLGHFGVWSNDLECYVGLCVATVGTGRLIWMSRLAAIAASTLSTRK